MREGNAGLMHEGLGDRLWQRAEAAEDVDSSRISPERMLVCSRSPTEEVESDGGGEVSAREVVTVDTLKKTRFLTGLNNV